MNTAFPGLGQPVNEYLGPGAVYVDYGLSTEVKLGLTKGGDNFNDGAVYREREADGDYAPVKGTRDLVKIMPVLTINELRIDVQSALKYFAGMVAAAKTSGAQNLYRQYDLSSSYLTNTTWVGMDRAGNNMAIMLDNALGDGIVDLTSAKDAEVVLPITFTAHIDPATFDPDTPSTWPYHFEFEVSDVTFTVQDDAGTPADVEGALVTLDDGQSGLTDVSGEVAFEVTFGKIGYTVTKAGSTTTTGIATVDEDPEAIAVTLPTTP